MFRERASCKITTMYKKNDWLSWKNDVFVCKDSRDCYRRVEREAIVNDRPQTATMEEQRNGLIYLAFIMLDSAVCLQHYFHTGYTNCSYHSGSRSCSEPFFTQFLQLQLLKSMTKSMITS